MGKAKRDDKAVFDGGAFSGPRADKDKGDRATAEGAFEAKWDRQRSSEQAVRRSVEGFEEKWANGFTRLDGRHIPADGVVSRRGYRRIVRSGPDREWLEERAEEVEKITKELLRGRTATVFEGRVLYPLMGRPQRSIEELAEQFGVPAKRIYKIEAAGRARVSEGLKRLAACKTDGDKCPTCGRVYAEWDFSQCARNNGALRDGYSGPTWGVDLRTVRLGRYMLPECLPPKHLQEAIDMQRKYLY
jgi:hypothetical protein